MSSKIQNLLLAALVVAVLAIYASYGLRDEPVPSPAPAPAPAVAEAAPAVLAPQDAAPLIQADSLSKDLYDQGQWRGKPVIEDLNGDGHKDLVAAIRRWDHSQMGEGLFVWLGDGAGNWTPALEGLRRDMGYGGSRVVDVNGDGHLDIAFSGHDVTPQVFLGDGQGEWRISSDGIYMSGPCSDVDVGDIDGDGICELVAIGQFPDNGGMSVFRRDGEEWTFIQELFTNADYGNQVRFADLDGDGKDEIIAATVEGPRVWRYEGGTTFAEQSEGLHTPEIGGTEMGILAHDFDGDGTKELLLSGMIYEGHVPMRCYRWDGERWSEWGEGLPADEAVFDIELGDVDGDGELEIIGAGRYGIVIIEAVAPGRFERVARIADTLSVVNLATGDVNGDGIDEIIAVYLGKGLQVLDIARALGGTV